MPRRTKAELLAEFHRLSDVFETACDIQCEIWPELTTTRHLITGREQMLDWVGSGKSTLSGIVSGVREALNDIGTGVQLNLKDGQPAGLHFLERYEERTGRAFFDDAGRPDAAIKAVVSRGRIDDDTEYRLLSGALADVDHPFLTAAQATKAEVLMAKYESTKLK